VFTGILSGVGSAQYGAVLSVYLYTVRCRVSPVRSSAQCLPVHCQALGQPSMEQCSVSTCTLSGVG